MTQPDPSLTTGGRLLADALVTHGVERVFCVPGESYLAVLDALYDVRESVELIVCRHEAGAANMAEAHGKLTGQPGIAMVTRGPGATHASIGVHTAMQDSTPMILFIGQIARDCVDREAFQEVDYRQMFGPLAKWVAQIDDARRIPEYLSHAFHVATSGRPGPVVLALPEDMLSEPCPQVPAAPRYQRVAAAPAPAQIDRLAQLLEAAERPLAILGGSGWTPEARTQFQQFAERWSLPVACAFRFQDCFDNDHPNYIGDVGLAINPALRARIEQADLVLAVGPRLGEATTGNYTMFDIPKPRQTLVHVHSGVDELGRVYAADLPINAGMPEFAAAVLTLSPRQAPRWAATVSEARAQYEAWNTPQPIPGDLQLGEIVQQLRDRLPDDAIVTNGAGNYATWVHRFFRYRHFKSQLAPTSGAMGYGVPAAIAAQAADRNRKVVAFAGDGCFLMNGQELATAVQYELPVLFIVVNNGHYGTIRMHQENHYPARVHGTALKNPDFAAYARSFGAYGEVVESTDQFLPALERAWASGGPALLELRLPQEAITPSATLSGLRSAALAKAKS